MLITTFVFKSNFSSPQMLFVWLLLMSCPAALHLNCEYISYAKRVNNNAVWGCVRVYKCGSNEVVSPVTTLAALRGSLIYHSNAPPVPPPAFYLSLPWTGAYTRGGLEIVSPEVRGALLGRLAGTDGLSNGPFPPPASSPCRDRLEKQGGRRALQTFLPQNCFDLRLGFYLTPNCESFPSPISSNTNHLKGYSC